MSRRNRFFMALAVLISALAAALPLESSAGDDLAQVRIKTFPVAMQCWTYRRYSFFEAVEKTKALGLKSVQAYPGQPLSAEDKGVVFSHQMADPQIDMVRKKLTESGMEVVGYGVVD